MSLEQLHCQIFIGGSLQAASKRLTDLRQNGFIERRRIDGPKGRIHSAFLNTPKAIKSITQCYGHVITSPLCKSDSIEHDVALVNVRHRLQRLSTVTNYLTENALQACRKFSEIENVRPFVEYNTDAAIELTRGSKKLIVGLEFESSEKAKDRYVRKLINYYADPHSPVILYVCTTARIRDAVVQAEQDILGGRSPRCFYSLVSNVLESNENCTFVDLKGAHITLQ